MLSRVIDGWIGTRRPRDPLEPISSSGLIGAVVVTGGSEGIGFEIARCFAERGHHVVLVARTAHRLERAVAKLREDAPNRAVSACPLDVTAEQSAKTLADWLEAHGLFCDVLVNNAAIGVSGTFERTEPGELERLLHLNVVALTRLSHAVLPAMLERQCGGILNVASFGGLPPGPFQAAYYASKAYVISLTEALAWETRGRGVRIAVSAPGPVETRFHAKMSAETALYRKILPGMTARRVARSAVQGFVWGRTVIVPGVVFPTMGLALRILPRKLQAAATGLLLKPRGARTDA